MGLAPRLPMWWGRVISSSLRGRLGAHSGRLASAFSAPCSACTSPDGAFSCSCAVGSASAAFGLSCTPGTLHSGCDRLRAQLLGRMPSSTEAGSPGRPGGGPHHSRGLQSATEPLRRGPEATAACLAGPSLPLQRSVSEVDVDATRAMAGLQTLGLSKAVPVEGGPCGPHI
jgi:hypothetical protein